MGWSDRKAAAWRRGLATRGLGLGAAAGMVGNGAEAASGSGAGSIGGSGGEGESVCGGRGGRGWPDGVASVARESRR